jgi:cytochrome c-L
MKNFRVKDLRPGGSLAVRTFASLLAFAAPQSATAEGRVQFLDPLNDTPLDISDQDVSEAVRQFHQSGENPYAGDQQAIAEGQTLYKRWCQACHLPDGSGRIGPSLNDDQWKYPRTETDQGKFEIIYAGGAGAMQAFGKRMDQDDILKLIAFVDTLQDK